MQKCKNRLSPLSTHMHIDAQKRNTYATFVLRLRSRSTTSDYLFAKIDVSFSQARDFHANFDNRGVKSAVRYAKTQNRLSPLSSHMDFDAQKCNTYATCFLTLHSLWAPSDFFLQKCQFSSLHKAT